MGERHGLTKSRLDSRVPVWSTEGRLLLSLACGAALILLASGLAIFALDRALQDVRRIGRAHEVIASLRSAHLCVAEVETALRAFLVSGERPLLSAVAPTQKSAREHLARVRRLTATSATQSSALDRLVALIEERWREVESAMQSGAGADATPAAHILATSVAQLDAIHDAIGDMLRVEEGTIARQAAASASATQARTLALAGATGVVLLLLAGGFLLVRRDLALRRSIDRFFSQSADLFCIAGFDGYFRHLNPQWEAALGWTIAELKAKSWLEFVHPEDRAATIAAAKRQTDEGQDVLHFTNRYLCKDGSYRSLEWMSVPSGAEGLIYAVARDVTEAKTAERRIADLVQELEHKNAEISAVNQELEAFSYSVSHDLRAPLRSIDGFSLALLEDCGPVLDSNGKEHLHRVRAATQRMGRLIDDLLALARVTRRELVREHVDLSALAETVIAELRAAEPAREVDVEIAAGLTVEGDSGLLRIALANLLGNAWKYTGKVLRAHIAFTARRGPEGLTFVVRDDGVGFEMAHVDKLFGAFQRLHGMDEFPGTGIGLATVRRVLRRHGGTIWAEGEVGRGASFYFTLPGAVAPTVESRSGARAP